MVALRTVFGCVAMGTNFWAVRQLALVQHTVIHLTQPILVAIVSPSLLRERLRGAAVVALVLALAGAVMVLLPPGALESGFSQMGAELAMPLLPGLVGLLSACASSMAHVMLRSATAPVGFSRDRDTPADAPETVVLHFTAVVSIGALVIGLALGGFRGFPADLGLAASVWRIAGMAALGWIGQLMMSRAYARAEAPAIAVVAYAGIPVAAVIDAWVWDADLGVSTLVGAAIMATAGWLLTRAKT